MDGTSFKPLKILSNTTSVVKKETLTIDSTKITIYEVNMDGKIAYSS
jgi:hypothetical protein